MEAAIILFVKNPELGKVKSRLAETMGQEKALDIYLALLKFTAKVCTPIQAKRLVYYSSFIPEKDDLFPSSYFESRLQSTENNLGLKMEEAFLETFKTNAPVIIIGSDCPSLSPEIINQAFQQLKNHDFVIGPAADGGYYLLGMRSFDPHVFANITWSCPNVFTDTLRNIQEHDQSHFVLETLSDIDFEADWEQFGWEL